jgi:hypothetical protein
VGHFSSRTIKLTNATSVAMTVVPRFVLQSGAYTVAMTTRGAQPGNFVIPANSELWVIVTFQPTATQKYDDVLTFTDRTGKNLAGTCITGLGVNPE